MEVTDFTTKDGRGQLQKLRRLLARAVSQSKADTAKNAWLTAVISSVSTDVTAGESWTRASTDTDSNSYNTVPGLIAALTKAAAEASEYAGDYKTQLLADLSDASTELAA